MIARLAVVLLLATSIAPDPVAITISPRIAIGPRATMRLVITVERDAANRRLVVTLESGSYLRRTVEQLEGEDSARVRALMFENIPSGAYVATALVLRNDGKTHMAATEACVKGLMDGDECG